MRNGSGGKVAQQFKVQGLAELVGSLKQLPDRLQEAAVRNATSAGARVIRDEAKRLVPVRTGQLRDSIVVARRFKQARNFRAVKGAVVVGIKGAARYYAHLIELGWSKSGARPFMRPALDSKAPEAIKVTGERLAKEIVKQAARLNSAMSWKRLKRLYR